MLCSTHAEWIFAKGRKLAAAYLPQEVAPNVILVRGTGVGPTGHRLGLSSTFDLACHPAIFLHPRFMVRYLHRRHLQEDGEHRSDSPSVAGDAAWIRTNRAGPLRHHHRRGGRLERCRLEGLVRGGQPLVGFRGSAVCVGADPPPREQWLPRSTLACGRRGRWRSDFEIDGILVDGLIETSIV